MEHQGPDGLPQRPSEAEVLEQQEQELRRALGDEHSYLVDLLQAGMDAHEFRASRAGKSLLKDLQNQMKSALAVLRDPDYDDSATLKAAYQLRVAFAATDAIAGAIAAGRRAGQEIDQLSSDEDHGP